MSSVMSAKGPLWLVEDDAVFAGRLGRALAARGYKVTVLGSVADARARSAEPDAAQLEYAVVDLKLGDGDGLEVVRSLTAAAPDAAVVVLTGFGSIPSAVEAMRLGAVDYLTKPATADAVVAALEGAGTPRQTEAPSLARVEWEHIQRVLAECDGNVSQAARTLGLHRRSLQRKLGRNPPRE